MGLKVIKITGYARYSPLEMGLRFTLHENKAARLFPLHPDRRPGRGIPRTRAVVAQESKQIHKYAEELLQLLLLSDDDGGIISAAARFAESANFAGQ